MKRRKLFPHAKRNWLLLVALVVLVFSLASCSSEGSAPYYTAVEEFYSNRSFSEALTKQRGYDADVCAKDVINSFSEENLWVGTSSMWIKSLCSNEENIFIRPLEKRINNREMLDIYYLVRGVKTATGIHAYAYTPFYEDRETDPGVLKISRDYTFYSAIPLTADDFTDIQPGDSIKKVEQIDPATSLYSDWSAYTIHLLDQGFMFVYYNSEDNSEDNPEDNPEDKTVKCLYYAHEGILEPERKSGFWEYYELFLIPNGDRIY